MTELPGRAVSIFKDEEDNHWVCNIQLEDVSAYARFVQDMAFTLDIYGEQWEFIVDSKELSRGAPAELSVTINGVSPTALKDFPRAQPYTVTHEVPIMARDAVELALGETVDWQMVDWLIPAYRLSAEQASPLEFANLIVNAAGGLLEAKKDGTFLARHRYPVSPTLYDVTEPDHSFYEESLILSVTEQFVPGKIENRIRISDEESNFNDRIEFEADENDFSGRSGELLVFLSPWRSPAQLLQTSPTSVITLTENDPWDKLKTISENNEGEQGVLVEITNGEGNVSYPIYEVDEVEWISNSLGAVTFEQYSTTIRAATPTEGYGLLRITYKTRYLSYNVVSTEDLPAQFILEDLT